MNRENDRTRPGGALAAPRALALLCTSVVVGACTTEQLPIGASLSISPETISIDVVENLDTRGRCILDADRYVDKAIVLALTDGQGSPLGGIDVTVYTDYSGNTFSRFPVLNLYDDRNGNSNGVVDAETELVSGADDAIAIVETGRFGGDRALLLRINTSCTYAGQVFAFADGVTASLQVEITATPEEEEFEEEEFEEEEIDPARSPFELTDAVVPGVRP